jgi:hypothetical protein
MTAVRRGTCREPGVTIDHSIVRPPTDVMAITSLPEPEVTKGDRKLDEWLG